MAMKELAYTAKHQLESATQQSFRHAHVYELLAACFGFKSSAALHTHHVLAVLDAPPVAPAEHLLTLRRRLTELGYSPVSETAGTVLLRLIQQRRLGAVSIEVVLDALNGDGWGYPRDWGWEDDDEVEVASQPRIDLEQIDLLMHGLTVTAQRDHAMAHYALALLYRGDEFEETEGSEYWHSQLAQGRELAGVELEWALAYRDKLSKAEREAFHLQEATRLGYGAAQQAEADFESSKQRHAEAAALGDGDAMRALIYEYDKENLFQNWVWVYLSGMLGNDLRNGTLRAYHEGGLYAGEPYDDDQGGPLYVEGDEGVELVPISPEQELEARRLAEQLFSRIAQ